MKQPAVNVTVLLDKLVSIEQAIGLATDASIRNMILDAEECLLELQREWLELPFKFQMEQRYSGKPQ